MNNSEFITEVYEVAWQCNPDLDHSSSFQDVLKELKAMKDKAMRWEIIVSSFKPEPELPQFDNSPERFKKLAQDRIGGNYTCDI